MWFKLFIPVAADMCRYWSIIK